MWPLRIIQITKQNNRKYPSTWEQICCMRPRTPPSFYLISSNGTREGQKNQANIYPQFLGWLTHLFMKCHQDILIRRYFNGSQGIFIPQKCLTCFLCIGELRYSFWVVRASSKATTVYITLTTLYTSNYWIVPDILSVSIRLWNSFQHIFFLVALYYLKTMLFQYFFCQILYCLYLAYIFEGLHWWFSVGKPDCLFLCF